MMHSSLLLIHISGAVIGLLSGFMAMGARKGSGVHDASGKIFVVSMLTMCSTAAYLAAFVKPNGVNLVVALLTTYLVTTGWRTAHRREAVVDAYDRVAFIFVALVTFTGFRYGLEAAGNPKGLKDGMPAFLYFMFATGGLLCVRADWRMIRNGGVSGMQRVARHLTRMSFALLIATMSFYPGQARNLPLWLKESKLVVLPHIFLIGAMIFYALRYRRRSRNGATASSPTALPSVRTAASA